MSQLVLLATTVVATLVAERWIAAWVAPLVGAVTGVALGIIDPDAVASAVGDLGAPLAFLMLAVPLSVELDRSGFFASLASRLDAGSDRRMRLGLWILAAGVVVVFNLDAAVVLLTPLYVRIARRRGDDPFALGIIPALLASLASCALPVSNLTNLIAAERLDLRMIDFATHLVAPTVAAVTVGWFMFCRAFPEPTGPVLDHDEPSRAGLRLGGVVVTWLLIGFTVGDAVGTPAWLVTAPALALVLVANRSLPVRHVPLDAAVIAVALGVVTVAAGPHLPIAEVLGSRGAIGEVVAIALAAGGANAMNNLPALLVALPALELHPDRVWAVLLGVNLGPTLWVFGALSTLLWRSTMRRLGIEVRTGAYVRAGAIVGLPALVAAGAVLVAVP